MLEVGRVELEAVEAEAAVVLAVQHSQIAVEVGLAGVVAQVVVELVAAIIITATPIIVRLQHQFLPEMETPAPLDQQAQQEIPALLATRVRHLQL